MDSDLIRCWRDTNTGQDQITRVYYNITSEEWNCQDHYGTCDSCPKLQADPDIAGVGVIAAFLVSATLTALLGLAFAILSAGNPPRKDADERRTLDHILAPYFEKHIVRAIGQERATRIGEICYEMVMCLGDQQPLTALALLVATIKKLHVDKTLSIFHLELLVNLILVTSTAFSFTIISWRIKHDRELQNDEPFSASRVFSQSFFWRRLRARLPIITRKFLILSLCALLLYTGWATARTRGLEKNCPALCFQNVTYDVKARNKWLATSWGYIYASLVVGWCQLFAVHPSYGMEPFMKRLIVKVKIWSYILHTRLEDRYDKEEADDKEIERMIQGTALMVQLEEASDPKKSPSTRLQRQMSPRCISLAVITLFYIVFFVNTLKTWGGKYRSMYEEDIKDETSLGFGQIVPIFLLIQPVLQLLDSISVHYKESEVNGATERELENGPERPLVARRNSV